jgi:hypothetical protein
MVVGFGGILGWDLHGPLAAAGRVGRAAKSLRAVCARGVISLGGPWTPWRVGIEPRTTLRGTTKQQMGKVDTAFQVSWRSIPSPSPL